MKKKTGFTLIEVLIVIVVIGVLSAIAYPAYSRYNLKKRRAQAQVILLQTVAMVEAFYNVNNFYPCTINPLPEGACFNAIYSPNLPPTAPGYSFGANPTTITATAIGSQTTDTQCPTIWIRMNGEKGPTMTCWEN